MILDGANGTELERLGARMDQDLWCARALADRNAGYWARPNWTFVDRVSPEEYLDDARRWVEAGATIVGGCCGVGVESTSAPSRKDWGAPRAERLLLRSDDEGGSSSSRWVRGPAPR